jgi:hypothetical protein
MLIMVAACLHNFGILHDNWIDDAPPMRREPLLQEENVEYYNSDEDEEDERRGFKRRRMFIVLTNIRGDRGWVGQGLGGTSRFLA